MATTTEPITGALPSRRGLGNVGAQGWSRFLLPSFADFQFLSILMWLFAAGTAGWTLLLMDGDCGWHIRTGDWIRANGRVPFGDPFSFSKPGQPWFAWEWGAELVLSFLHSLAGLRGVVLFAGIQIAVFGALLFRHSVWRGANLFVALPLSLLAIGAATSHALARPHLWTLVLFAGFWFVLDRDRERPSRAIWTLPLLTALWVNVHGGWAGWMATLAVFTVGRGLEALSAGRSLRELKRYVWLGAACLAATFVNPYGWRLHAHVIGYLRASWIQAHVAEFQSPRFRDESMFQFEVLLVAGLLAAGVLLWRKRFAEALVVLFWAHSSLVSARHLTLYCTVAVPAVAGLGYELWSRWAEGRKRSTVPGILDGLARDAQPSLARYSLWCVAPLLWLAVTSAPLPWPSNFPKEVFPVELVERYRSSIEGRRVLSSDQWSDYLIYRFEGKQKVFFDGRSDFYGPDLGNEYLAVLNANHNWAQVLDRYRIDAVLAPHFWSLNAAMKLAPEWRIVADDSKGILFERRRPLNSGPSALMNSRRSVDESGRETLR